MSQNSIKKYFTKTVLKRANEVTVSESDDCAVSSGDISIQPEKRPREVKFI